MEMLLLTLALTACRLYVVKQYWLTGTSLHPDETMANLLHAPPADEREPKLEQKVN